LAKANFSYLGGALSGWLFGLRLWFFDAEIAKISGKFISNIGGFYVIRIFFEENGKI
jgi:hypothetical protein